MSSPDECDWRYTKPGSRIRRKDCTWRQRHVPPTEPKDNPMAAVWRDTQRLCTQLPRPPKGKLHTLDRLPNCVPCESGPLVCYVENQHTLAMAHEFVAAGLNPLVLNMASSFKPGGGVTRGALAQEEELFRRTTACLTHDVMLYPLNDESYIYSPVVTTLKDEHYAELPPHERVSYAMITIAALRAPKVAGPRYRHDEDRALMARKVRAMFQVGIRHGHDSLVLGAFGCGAYRNPPEAVCDLFREALALYGRYFKRVGFAVLVAKEADQHNYDVFFEGITATK